MALSSHPFFVLQCSLISLSNFSEDLLSSFTGISYHPSSLFPHTFPKTLTGFWGIKGFPVGTSHNIHISKQFFYPAGFLLLMSLEEVLQ